ncbi:MAG: YabN family protein [Thioalkalivibrionaceae bacterium]
MSVRKSSSTRGIDQLLEIMAALRDPDWGCPWDRAQTVVTLIPHIIEESFELAEAVARYQVASDDDGQSLQDLRGELGDALFQVVFLAQIGHEQGLFDFDDIAQDMAEKLIRRHPHVFGTPENPTDIHLLPRRPSPSDNDLSAMNTTADTRRSEESADSMNSLIDSVAAPNSILRRETDGAYDGVGRDPRGSEPSFGSLNQQWESIKAAERQRRQHTSEVDDIPIAAPALIRAQKLGRRAARVGFDFPNLNAVWGKIEEERLELQNAIEKASDQFDRVDPTNRLGSALEIKAHTPGHPSDQNPLLGTGLAPDVANELHRRARPTAEKPPIGSADVDTTTVIEEFGDFLFSAVNLARHLGIDAESALRAANRKFEARFRCMESLAGESGKRLETLDADEKEALYQQARNRLTKASRY